MAAATVPLVAALPRQARAQALYWDGNGAATGAALSGGAMPTGNWGVDSFWNSLADGTGNTGPYAIGNTAVFSAGTDAIGSFTVTVSGAQSISAGANIEEGTLTFSGGSLDLGATGGATVDVSAGAKATVSSVLSGSGARMTKSGSGTLVLGTVINQLNSFDGGVTLNGGVTEFQGENSATAGQFNPLGVAPGSVVPAYLQLGGGAVLRSFRNTTNSSFVLPNRGVQLSAGGGAFDVANATASLSYSGVISGTGAFTKQGAGELRVSGSSTYTGGITIKAGKLSFATNDSTTAGAATPLGAYPSVVTPGNIVIDGGTLKSTSTSTAAANFVGPNRGISVGAGGATLELAGTGSGGVPSVLVYTGKIAPVSGVTSAALTKTGPGELRLSAGNTYHKLVITGGLVQANTAGADTAFGATPTVLTPDAITVNGAAIGTNTGVTTPVNRGITVGASGMGVILNGGWTISSVITGAGGITLGNIYGFTGSGSQTLSLTATNTYQGDTTVNLGTLSAVGGKAIPDTGNVVISSTSSSVNTAIFDVSPGAGVTETIAQLTGGGPNSNFSGRVFLNTGTLAVGNGNASFTYGGDISGGGQLQKIGTGVMTINNWDYTNTGMTIILAGSIKYGNASAGLSNTSTINLPAGAAGTLDMSGFADTVGALAGGGPIINGGNLTVAGANVTPQTYSGNYSGGGMFTKDGPGTQNLTGSNAFGTVTVLGGVLGVNSSNALGTSLTNALVLDGGTLLTNASINATARSVTVNAAGGTIDSDLNLSTFGNVTGAGNFTKAGGGTITVAQVRVNDLSLTGGTLTIAPNGTATGVSVVNSTTIAAGAKLDLRDNKVIDHTTGAGSWGGSAYGGLSGMVAAARNGGTWNGTTGINTSIAGANDYTTLGVASAADVKGISGTATATWAGQTVSPADALVMFTYGGDANLDGQIDIDDYTQIDSSAAVGGALKGWFNGDFNYDGDVNIDDYTIIDSNLGTQGAPFPTAAGIGGAAAPAIGVSAVPEPATSGLIGLGALLIAGRRLRGRNWRR